MISSHRMFATRAEHWLYTHVAKPIFFRFDPEQVHDRMVSFGKTLGRTSIGRRAVKTAFAYSHPALVQELFGIRFPNPVGLTAGFDKNAELTEIVPSVGFGFEEVGSITGEPCEGNPKPRLWRLPKSKGLVVWYGLKNEGSEALARRLEHRSFDAPVGTSVARTNSPQTMETEAGIADYAKAFRAFATIGDYTTVNISCPNTCGGEPFTDPERLHQLLVVLDDIPTEKPVFLKVSADLSTEELNALVAVCDNHRVHGFVISNLTKRYDRPAIDPAEREKIIKGGVSGRAVFDPSNELISHLFQTAGERYLIIGSGGIFSVEDAYEKIRRGASLVQLATGMIFEGPQLIGEINRGLVELLGRDGYSHLREAVGSYYRTVIDDTN